MTKGTRVEEARVGFRHAEKFRHALGCGATADGLCDTFQYQPLISKFWERIILSQYELLYLEVWTMSPHEALAT